MSELLLLLVCASVFNVLNSIWQCCVLVLKINSVFRVTWWKLSRDCRRKGASWLTFIYVRCPWYINQYIREKKERKEKRKVKVAQWPIGQIHESSKWMRISLFAQHGLTRRCVPLCCSSGSSDHWTPCRGVPACLGGMTPADSWFCLCDP